MAHNFSPQVVVGKYELTKGSLSSINQSLDSKELIKIKFTDNNIKKQSIHIIENELNCNIVGSIGKVLILYRQQEDIDKRKIVLD